MNNVKQITRKILFFHLITNKGLKFVAHNIIEDSDYAIVCIIPNTYGFEDFALLDVANNMGASFQNNSAIEHVKEYIRSINSTIRFADEVVTA